MHACCSVRQSLDLFFGSWAVVNFRYCFSNHVVMRHYVGGTAIKLLEPRVGGRGTTVLKSFAWRGILSVSSLATSLDGLHVWRRLKGHPERLLRAHLASFGIVVVILTTSRSILLIVLSSALRRSQSSRMST